ncbi:MAG: UrcA family protein [Gammaproteobacteria bacterium]|nr:MAG: UrcA family protein [Gammaproteobacteria bacterium]
MTSATSTDLLRASAALTACLIVGASATAYAAAPTDPSPSVQVSYHDLDLATEQGTQALYARIVSAAHKVCEVRDIRNLAEFAAASACREQAIARAVRDVNNPRLAALYTAHQRHG